MNYAGQMPPQVTGLPFSLVAISVAAGIVMMLLFKVASNPGAIRRAKRRVQAQLLALRLFGDEPALVWRAQVRLLTGNARYLAVMLVPVVAAAIPFLLAYPHLEALYGRAALPVGSETVLTVRLRPPFSLSGESAPRLEVPAGLELETPGVRVPEAGEISWRLRAAGPVSGPVRISVGGADVTKAVQVGNGHGYLADTRPGGVLAWLLAPGESPIGASTIESVHVVYRSQRLSALGLGWPWEAWFIVISVITALLVKNRLGVVF
ncbi:MAG TPA: hypothetical protein VLY24_11460 [Bryobacteraceae bacterium]|nr:hypothetical protein [Bryobacteraceae bacterium]